MDTSKRILILIFVSMGIACFSEDIPLEETEADSECFECFDKGANLLLLNESQGALEYFEKGHQLAAQSQSDAVILDFCLYFSETMILDMFGYQEQCARSLSSMLHVLEAIENSEEEDKYTSNFYEKIDFAEMQRSQDLIVKMRHLAGMASSLEVRAILFYVVERIGEELLPEFQFSDPFYLQQEDWTFGTSGNDAHSLDLCKKNKNHKKKKKHEDWFDKLEKWAERGLRLYKLYREIKKMFEE
jgi:hypothetical protein